MEKFTTLLVKICLRGKTGYKSTRVRPCFKAMYSETWIDSSPKDKKQWHKEDILMFFIMLKLPRTMCRNFKRRKIIFPPSLQLSKWLFVNSKQFRWIVIVFKVRNFPCWRSDSRFILLFHPPPPKFSRVLKHCRSMLKTFPGF